MVTLPTVSRPAFQTLYPRRLGPFILTCEHAGKKMPPEFDLSRAERRAVRDHWGWDPSAWGITRGIAQRTASVAVGSVWSRLYLDLNRDVCDPTLARASAGDTELSFNRNLTPEALQARVEEIHLPFHGEVDRIAARHRLHGQQPWIVAVHSFTSHWNGREREFDFGLLYDRHSGAARRIVTELRAQGWSCRYNQPYSGRKGMIYSAERHGRLHGLTCVELEINQGRFASRERIAAAAEAFSKAMLAARGE